MSDYQPGRTYQFVQFIDGTGKSWWKIRYAWGFWTYYVRNWMNTDYGWTATEMSFDTQAEAESYLERLRNRYELQWMKSQVTKIAGETWKA
jgi:hypothetical protein